MSHVKNLDTMHHVIITQNPGTVLAMYKIMKGPGHNQSMPERYTVIVTLGTTVGLTGRGEEWIVDPVTQEVIARFWNGNFITSSLSHRATDGPTLILKAA